MPHLRFDTNQGQSALAQFRRTVETMEAELNTARSAADRLVGNAWQAPAANEFRESMTAWQQHFSQALECLTGLNGRLEAEIQEWEETGRTFGEGSASTGGGITFPNHPLTGGNDPGSIHSVPGSPANPALPNHHIDDGTTPANKVKGKTLFSKQYDSETGWSNDQQPPNFVTGDISANFVKVEGERGASLNNAMAGPVALGLVGYSMSGSARVGIGEDGLEAHAEGGIEGYLVEAEYDAQLAGIEVAAEAQIGASITGEGQLEFDLLDGEVELEGQVDAFVGVTAELEVSKELGPAEVSATGEVGAGLGFSASGELEFEDGTFTLEGGLSGYLGVGAGLDFSVEIDIPEAADNAADMGKKGIEAIGDFTGWW